MGPSSLQAWHDFFALTGSVAATLIGAMFVVVSLGIGFLKPDHARATSTFLSATVVHLSIVLFCAALTMVPALPPIWFGVGTGLLGLFGLGLALRALAGFRHHQHTEGSDGFWYVALPLLANAVLAAAGATTLWGSVIGVDLLAAALLLLLVAGIRNAWDMIVFFITRPRD